MKRFKILAVIAIIALAGCLWISCSSGDSSSGDGGDGGSTVNGWQGGKRLPGSSTPSSGGASAVPVVSGMDVISWLGGESVIKLLNGVLNILAAIDTKGENIRFDYPVQFAADTEITVSEGTYIRFAKGIISAAGQEKDLTVKGGGTVELYSPASIKSLTVDDGGTVKIYGVPNIKSDLKVDAGSVSFDGDAKIGGALITNGSVDIGGDAEITGDLSVTGGAVSIAGDLLKTTDLTVADGGAVTLNGDAAIAGVLTVTDGTVSIAGDLLTALTVAGGGAVTLNGAKIAGALTVTDGTVTLNLGDSGESTIGGALTVTKGELKVTAPAANGDKATVGVTGAIAIAGEGALTIQDNVVLAPKNNVTVTGKLALDGVMTINTGKTLTLNRALEGTGAAAGTYSPNQALGVTGAGILAIANGATLDIKVVATQMGGDKYDLIPLASGATAAFGVGSVLKLSILDSHNEYKVLGTSADIGAGKYADFAIISGNFYVSNDNGDMIYYLKGEATAWGGQPLTFGPPLDPTPTVTLWADFLILPGSTLTIGSATVDSIFKIDPGYGIWVLSDDDEGDAEVEVLGKGVVINLGTFSNNGTVTNTGTGKIYSGFSTTTTVGTFPGAGTYTGGDSSEPDDTETVWKDVLFTKKP